MEKSRNWKYKTVPHIKEYLENDFQRKKLIIEHEENRKYFKVEYFEEVANYCGISQATISQMHTRNLLPSYIVAIKLSEYLGIEVTTLFEIVEK